MHQLREGDAIEIPPNGLIYVGVLETVNIPYFMIARFNMKVSEVYRGLLLGTGPQVNPGFSGHLACPIHNLTNENKYLYSGDQFAQIDFIKTTPLPPDLTVNSRGVIDTDEVVGYQSFPFPLWSGHDVEDRTKRSIPDRLPRGESVRSGLQKLTEDVRNNFHRQLIQFAAVFALVTILISVFVVVLDVQRHVPNLLVSDSTADELSATDSELRAQIEQVQEELAEMRSEFEAIQGATGAE